MNRKAVRITLAAALGLAATVVPAAAEKLARDRLTHAAEACLDQGTDTCVGARSVRVDLTGVHLEEAALRRGAETTQLAVGDPKWLRDHSENPDVREFLNRGEADAA